jgi:hypothetical protein
MGGSHDERGPGAKGLDEHLSWSRWCFYCTGWLHKGHQHYQDFLSSRGRLRTPPSSLLQRSIRSLLRLLQRLTPQFFDHSLTKTSRPPLESSSHPRLPQYRASPPRPRAIQLRYPHVTNDARGGRHARSYTLPSSGEAIGVAYTELLRLSVTPMRSAGSSSSSSSSRRR